MIHKQHIVSDRVEIEQIVRECRTCRIGMVTPEGMPYIVPMSFGYLWDENGLRLFFHTGHEGRKMDALRQNPKVCFEMDIEGELVGVGGPACGYSYTYRSLMGEGEIAFAEDDAQKRQWLDQMMRQYTGRGAWEYSARSLAAVEVMRLTVRQFAALAKPKPSAK